MVRVLLADDHKIVRQGTRLYLETMGIDVLGEAVNGYEALEMCRHLKPDVVIMDIHMPELTGIEATRRIHHEAQEVRILILTAYDTPSYIHALLDAGADGFVLKTAELSELYRALQEVAIGKRAFSQEILQKASQHERATPLAENLSEREIEVIREAAKGLTNKQIGQKLFISDRTVQGHLQNIYQKLHVATRTEAVTLVMKQGLISQELGER